VTATFAAQIELDDWGIAWIGGTKVKIIEVVLDQIAYGMKTRTKSTSRSGADWKNPTSLPPIFPTRSSGATD